VIRIVSIINQRPDLKVLDAIRELENEEGKKVTGVDQLFKALGEGKLDDVSA
jgi:hypothetical protein